jgi:hypothetical protein
MVCVYCDPWGAHFQVSDHWGFHTCGFHMALLQEFSCSQSHVKSGWSLLPIDSLHVHRISLPLDFCNKSAVSYKEFVSQWFHIFSSVAQLHISVMRKTIGFISCRDSLNVNGLNITRRAQMRLLTKEWYSHGVYFLFFLMTLGFEFRVSHLLGRYYYHLSHSISPFLMGFLR